MLSLGILAVLAVGCGVDGVGQTHLSEDVFNQESSAKVDILWVVDNSPSMREEQKKVAEIFDVFATRLVDAAADFHLGVITTDLDETTPNGGVLLGDPPVLTRELPDFVKTFQDRVRVGINGADMEQGLEAGWKALSEPLISGPNVGFLRDDAMLSVIFLSDEDDCSDQGALPDDADQYSCTEMPELLVPVGDYVEDFRLLKDHSRDVSLSAIIGPDVVRTDCDAKPGTRYADVSYFTVGIAGNICDKGLTGILDELGLLASGARISFLLSYMPVPDSLRVYVYNRPVIEDEENGWTFDPDTLYVTFHGDAVPPLGSTIRVRYEIVANAA